MATQRTYRDFTHREAVFRVCCDAFDAVTAEIVHQRQLLERYIERHPEFRSAFEPIDAHDDAPDSAKRMAAAAHLVGVGPMAAVAGTMAQLAAEAALRSGAAEVIVENGGDIYLRTTESTRIALHTGTERLASQLAFALEPDDTPLAICSSSGKMGHSTSLGRCDLATVVAKSAALADAAATMAANLVQKVDDVDAALNRISTIDGIDGVLIVQEDRIGLAGPLPEIVRTRG